MPKQGEVVLVPFPFSDLSGQKVRPAVVVSAITSGQDIIVVFVTSQIKKKSIYQLPLKPSVQSGIKVPSVIVCDKIATLDTKIVLGAIGKLSDADLRQMKSVIKTVLGL